jgi:heme/copper-type cytochrome/quinol oxidase subunit 3
MSSESRPFNREKFLLFLLSGIFIFQAALLAFGIGYCARNGGLKSCPAIGDRYETTFNVMIATTLALLTGGAVAAGVSQRRDSSSDDRVSLEQKQTPVRQPLKSGDQRKRG